MVRGERDWVQVRQAGACANTALHDAARAGFAETSLPVPGTSGLRSTQPEIAAGLRELGADD